MDAARLRRRFLIGLLVGAAVASTVIYLTASGASRAVATEASREGLSARVLMLTDVLDRFGTEGDAVRATATAFDQWDPAVSAVRVVVIAGLRLEASTAAADTGESAAPRKLQREEKSLFDLAQLLRASVENNRDPSAPRKDEVVFSSRDDGQIEVAAPLERDGEVVGMVQAVAVPPPATNRPPWWPPVALVAVMMIALAILARLVGPRPWALAVLTVVILIAGLAWLGREESRGLAAQHAAAAEQLAATVRAAGDFARVQLATEGVAAPEPPLEPGRWVTDAQRRPTGLVAPDGTVDEKGLTAAVAGTARIFRRALLAAIAVGAALALLFGLGGAASLASTVSHHRVAYGYVSPALVGMIVLVFFPFAYGIAISFTNQSIYNVEKPLWEIWVGVDNYVDILSDVHIATETPDGLAIDYTNFYWTLGFTIAWTVTNVAIGVSVGLLLALILNTKGLRFRPLYRVLLILPWAVPNYITALIWKGMFHKQFGVINQVIQMFGGVPVSWFEKPFTSFCAVVTTNGWLSFPFMMVICLGALQSIPSDLYEAARVDGATRWQQFANITLPSIKPALVPAVIISVVWTFNMFNIIYLVSAGEPAHATEILITDAYKLAFEQYRYGYAAAYSTVIFGILLVYGVWQNRVTGASEGI
jgi:arabinogalactan oligomer/maltooligosaccharide transport system permease protein